MRQNSLRAKLRDGERVLGVSLQQFRSAETPRIFAAAGFDFVWLDAEHGLFDFETIQDLTRSALDIPITPLVRVAELHYSLVARALDAGAQGIILPRVEDPRILAEAISWTKFPPSGKRGFGLGLTQLDYKPAAFDEIVAHQNANNMVIVQVETVEALRRAEELLSVDQLDGVLVGPSDLSISMGAGGRFEDARFVAEVEALCGLCRARGVVPGIHVRTLELANKWIDRGMQLVSVGTDATILYERARDIAGEFTRHARARQEAAAE